MRSKRISEKKTDMIEKRKLKNEIRTEEIPPKQ
jgi:hypothetical protein